MELGRFGIWTSILGLMPAAQAREALVEIEEIGYGAVWFPEGVGSKEAFSQATTLLCWTSRIVVATGIANIYARDPMAMANGARGLSEAFLGRFLLGVGVSHVPSLAARGGQASYGKPVATMRAYLDAMDAAPYRGVAPPEEPRVLAALGPRMLDLAAERTLGAHPYFVPVEHTRFARDRLGEGPLLASEQAVVFSTDADEARRVARSHMRYYLELDNYRGNLLRLGWSEDDLANDGSDELVDAIVVWGDAEAVAARIRAHLDAGADHVSIQALTERPDELPLAALRELRAALGT